MTTYAPQLGDLVDAEYIESIHISTPAKLRGIVTGIGDWNGNPTYSVTGYDKEGRTASTWDSTMPVHFLASGKSEAARKMLATRYAESEGRIASRLEHVAELMGASL